MIVVDASVLIAHLDGRDVHHERAVELLRAAVGTERLLIASVMTLAEVLVGPNRAGVRPVAEQALAALDVRPVALGENVPARLASLRAHTGMKMPDCCVLLAAQEYAAKAVLSFDAKLREAARAAGYATTVE